MPVRHAIAHGSQSSEAGELRERILRASVELIEEEGLAHLSMREVARRAGVTHQAPYHHFTDREAILGEIAELGFRMLGQRIEQVDRKSPSCGPERQVDRLIALGETYVEFACKHPAHFRIMFRPELVDLERCPGARAEGDKTFGAVQRIVHEAVEAGVPAEPSEAALVAFLWSTGHGLACLLLDGPLAMKMPNTAREAQVAGVMQALGALLRASLSAPKIATRKAAAAKSGKRTKLKRASS
jgi:AcrR family transcriptional regulator